MATQSASRPALQAAIRRTTAGGDHWFEIGRVDDGSRIAYAAVIDFGNFAWIEQIEVHVDHRGQGLATRLLTAVLAEFGDRPIRLSACAFETGWAGGKPGLEGAELRAWYGRHGFQEHADEDIEHQLIRPAAHQPHRSRSEDVT